MLNDFVFVKALVSVCCWRQRARHAIDVATRVARVRSRSAADWLRARIGRCRRSSSSTQQIYYSRLAVGINFISMFDCIIFCLYLNRESITHTVARCQRLHCSRKHIHIYIQCYFKCVIDLILLIFVILLKSIKIVKYCFMQRLECDDEVGAVRVAQHYRFAIFDEHWHINFAHCRSCARSGVPHYAHSLELLLHGALQAHGRGDVATPTAMSTRATTSTNASNAARASTTTTLSAATKASTLPTTTSTSDASGSQSMSAAASRPLLQRVVEFLRRFSQFPEVVMRCARKTDVRYWHALFQYVGDPEVE